MQYSSTITMSHKEMNYMRMCIRIFEELSLIVRRRVGVSYRTIQRKMSVSIIYGLLYIIPS